MREVRTISDGKIVIDTALDSKGLEKGVSGLSGKIGSFAKGSLGMFAKGIAVVGTAMGVAGLASIKLGSDLTEIQNVVDVTFGDNASKINSWAKSAATSFGIGELQAKQFSGTMGAMLKSMGMTSDETLNMSEGIVSLAGDFGSFYNLDSETAFEKIRSGMSGEIEPLRQLGINMSVASLSAYALSSGVTKSYESMSEAEKTTLRYNYLLSVSKDAQGDFGRTSESLANQLRIAKLGIQDLGGAIGTALLPMAGAAMKEMNGFITQLKDAFSTGGFEGLAGALGNVVASMITSIATQLPNFVNMAVMVIQSFVNGIQTNLPAISSAAVQIITSLITAFFTLLPQLLNMGLQLIGNLALGLGQALPTLIPLAIQCILSLVTTIIENLPLILDAGLQILTGLIQGILTALPQFMAMLPTIITSIVSFIVENLPTILEAGLTILLALIDGLVKCLPQLIAMLPMIIDSVITVITENLPMILAAGITILIAVINGLVNALPQLISMLPTIITTIITVITDNLPAIINAGIQILIAVISGLIQSIPQLIAAIPQIISAIKDAFTDIDWGEIGMNILSGIGKGIIAGVGSVISAAAEAAEKIKKKFTDFFDINSPSRVMRDLVGKNLVKGIGVGVDIETPNLNKDIDKNMSNLTAKMKSTVDFETARTTASVVAQNNFSIAKDNTGVVTTTNNNGVTQNVTIVNPTRTPSENARALKKVGRDLAFG